MEKAINIIDVPWDENRTLREYILDLYNGGENIFQILKQIEKRFPNYFKNEDELRKLIMRTIEPNRYRRGS